MKYITLLFALLFTTTAWCQTKLIEKVTKTGDEIVIPYEKYELDNGLTLIIHEDHSDPIVHVDVTYHVGSARETPGKSGFAHFFTSSISVSQGLVHPRTYSSTYSSTS